MKAGVAGQVVLVAMSLLYCGRVTRDPAELEDGSGGAEAAGSSSNADAGRNGGAGPCRGRCGGHGGGGATAAGAAGGDAGQGGFDGVVGGDAGQGGLAGAGLGGLDGFAGGDAGQGGIPGLEGEGGDAATGGAAGAPGTEAKCPTGLPGPSLVKLSTPGGTEYCFDSTEVTNEDYAAFLDAVGTAPLGAPHQCDTNNTSLMPWNQGQCHGSFDPVERAEYPVACVDWCDAWEYCSWAGKRLCGRAGTGEELDPTYDLHKVEIDEWYNACSAGGSKVYPYGGSYDENACGYTEVQPVETPSCEGGFDGIYDLSGNVSEWFNACREDGNCSLRGSDAWLTPIVPGVSQCLAYIENWGYAGSAYTGIRCCADVEEQPTDE